MASRSLSTKRNQAQATLPQLCAFEIWAIEMQWYTLPSQDPGGED